MVAFLEQVDCYPHSQNWLSSNNNEVGKQYGIIFSPGLFQHMIEKQGE